MHLEVTQQTADAALNLFRSLGFSRYRQPNAPKFEAHLLENRQFLVIDGPLMVQIGNLQFYDLPTPDLPVFVNQPGMQATDAVVGADRRFRWDHSFFGLSTRFPINQRFITAAAASGPYIGFPFGFVTNDPARV